MFIRDPDRNIWQPALPKTVYSPENHPHLTESHQLVVLYSFWLYYSSWSKFTFYLFLVYTSNYKVSFMKLGTSLLLHLWGLVCNRFSKRYLLNVSKNHTGLNNWQWMLFSTLAKTGPKSIFFHYSSGSHTFLHTGSTWGALKVWMPWSHPQRLWFNPSGVCSGLWDF